jgi:hypothetical protein
MSFCLYVLSGKRYSKWPQDQWIFVLCAVQVCTKLEELLAYRIVKDGNIESLIKLLSDFFSFFWMLQFESLQLKVNSAVFLE